MSNVVPIVVIALALALGAAVLIPLARGTEADYGRITPPPRDGAQGDKHQVVVVQTNVHDAELRISGQDTGASPEPALAFDAVGLLANGDILTLGRSVFDCDTGVYPAPVPPATPYYALAVRDGDALGLAYCTDSNAAAADTEATLALYAGDVELAAYSVALAVPTPTIVPTVAGQPPRFAGDFLTRQICVDDTADRAAYFTGDKLAGAAVTATGSGAAYRLAAADGLDYALFDVDAATGQVSVSALGAEDTSGLDSGLYAVVVQVEDSNGLTADTHLAVQVALTASPAGNGLCP